MQCVGTAKNLSPHRSAQIWTRTAHDYDLLWYINRQYFNTMNGPWSDISCNWKTAQKESKWLNVTSKPTDIFLSMKQIETRCSIEFSCMRGSSSFIYFNWQLTKIHFLSHWKLMPSQNISVNLCSWYFIRLYLDRFCNVDFIGANSLVSKWYWFKFYNALIRLLVPLFDLESQSTG